MRILSGRRSGLFKNQHPDKEVFVEGEGQGLSYLKGGERKPRGEVGTLTLDGTLLRWQSSPRHLRLNRDILIFAGYWLIA